ncbi:MULTISPECIES: hypothetical protein [unclassified Streptomyces]|uniref:hypothetical protein n=1 Tax=unclassified Streptomyces TaxID=2593676 RepID=UPI002366BDD3|nr:MULTISPECIES: hypothetical protein [unclassified Streptomyces]MDF3141804.1 hypothetical protein [Streptomyces sp. T21Q-yed]WDF45093.1 hypothetical protein PBV52_51250 [Streptomyces sp. T12]
MVADRVWHRLGGIGVAVVFTIVMAVANYAGDPSAGQVLVAVVFAGGLRAAVGFSALGNMGITGLWRQQMTWDVYRDRVWKPHEAALAAEADQMRKVDARVTTFATEHGMERITLAVAGARLGWWGAAESVRSSRTLGHIELGHFWFFPEGAASLPHIVEHELAHIQRNDSRTFVLMASAGAMSSVACAGLLALPHAAAGITVLFAVCTATSWWAELACDRIAARRCGRSVAVSALTHFLDDSRALPAPTRLVSTAIALRSHPPFRLRRWWIQHALAPASCPAD